MTGRAKHWTIVAACTSALLAGGAPAAAGTTVKEQRVAFAKAYVAAVQSKDRARIMAFFHPVVRACVTDKTRPFFDSIVAQQLEGFPSGKYSSISINRVDSKSQPSLWAYLPAKAFPYPVMPTYDIQVDFDSAPDGLFIDSLEVAPSGTSWYLVTACPNAEGMRLVQEMLNKAKQQKETAKKLVSKLHDPLLAQIKKLLADHDKMGAIKAYQKATGADLPTAASVVDLVENPNG